MTTVIPAQAVAPATSVTVEQELWAFAAKHDIELRVGRSEDGESIRSFGVRDDGGFVLWVTPDRSLADVLAFAHTVIARHDTDKKVLAVAAALREAGDGASGFAELAKAFMHATAWKLNAAGEFINLIETVLAGEQA